MPVVSQTHGFLCPRPGCGGFAGTNETNPESRRSVNHRKHRCRKCGHRFSATEVAEPIALDWLCTQLRQRLNEHQTIYRTEEQRAVLAKLRREIGLAMPTLREIQAADWEYVHPAVVGVGEG